jgi:DNA (cytosine-5)-methyltransferase 1
MTAQSDVDGLPVWPVGRRPRLLDLFCGGGGASAGYHAAGFDVTGVDIADQPDYPFAFVRADALSVDLAGFDVVAASPPCQRYSRATPTARRSGHPDLIEPVRQRLREAAAAGVIRAYVIENVPGAPLLDPVTVCGDALRLGVRRHRLFESNLPLTGTPCWHDRPSSPVPVYGSYGQRGRRRSTSSTNTARAAMGIDWLPWPALAQAIPPAFTHWIGVQLLTRLVQDGFVTLVDGESSPQAATSVTLAGGVSSRSSTGIRHSTPALSLARTIGTPRQCRYCGTPLPARPATGRWPRYCSHACRQAAYRHRRATPAGQP